MDVFRSCKYILLHFSTTFLRNKKWLCCSSSLVSLVFQNYRITLLFSRAFFPPHSKAHLLFFYRRISPPVFDCFQLYNSIFRHFLQPPPEFFFLLEFHFQRIDFKDKKKYSKPSEKRGYGNYKY